MKERDKHVAFERKLVEKYPLLYRDMWGDARSTCMSFGIGVGEGWWPIIEDLSAKLEPKVRELKEQAENIPNISCEFCGREKKWHWLRFLVGTITCLFKNLKRWPKYAWQRIKQNRKWRANTKGYKFEHNIGLFSGVFRFVRWHKPCRRFQVPHPCAAQVKEKFGCYDDQTRVLTKGGWKYFADLNENDLIATLSEDGRLEYQLPTDIIRYRYSGKMYRLVTRGVDLLVTPNHNLYVAKGTYYNGRYSPPKKVERDFEITTFHKYFGKNKRFKKDVIWEGEDIENFVLPYKEKFWSRGRWGVTGKRWPEMTIQMDDWLRFLGWYVAEGCVSGTEVSVSANNTDGGIEKSVVARAIRKCGFDASATMEDRPAMCWRIYEKRLASWLKENCGTGASKKRVPNFVKDLSPRQILIFLEALYAGDGCEQPTSYIYTTVSKQLADDVCELLLKCGYAFRYWKRNERSGLSREIKSGRKITSKFPPYEINWLKGSQYHNTSNKGMSKSSVEDVVHYDGMVYCVSVPNRIIFVERNGKGVWCGNSLRFYMTLYNEEIEKLIGDAEKLSYKTCEYCGAPGRSRDGGWIKVLCDDCENKR